MNVMYKYIMDIQILMYFQQHGYQKTWEEIVKHLDPEGEGHAYEVDTYSFLFHMFLKHCLVDEIFKMFMDFHWIRKTEELQREKRITQSVFETTITVLGVAIYTRLKNIAETIPYDFNICYYRSVLKYYDEIQPYEQIMISFI